MYDQGPVYMGDSAFSRCVKDLEDNIKWKYKGGAHLILTDFVYNVTSEKGNLDFSRTIALNISGLLHEKKLAQLSNLIEELKEPFREQATDGNASVFQASDYLALLKTREHFWKYLVKKFGLLLGLADKVAPYAVRDLRKAHSAPT